MILIACTTGTEALYRRRGDEGEDLAILGVRVEAWDDQGAPLVAGRNGLIPAITFRDNRLEFIRLSGKHTYSGDGALEPVRFPVRDEDPAP